jgi:allantoinase
MSHTPQARWPKVAEVLLFENGKIKSILSPETIKDNIVQLGDNRILMPGVIDPHVHINEPGRTEWEGFDTATKAAAAGGITTLIDMPLNSSPVTTSIENLKLKIEAAGENAHVNCGFYGGVVPGNLHKLEEMLEAGVFGLKAFLTHSGIDDFPATKPDELRDVLLLLKKYDRPLLVHCELDEYHEGIERLKENPSNYFAYLNSRPHSWEDNAIRTMIKLCRETNAHVHIVHLSSATALPDIIAARRDGLHLTVETAPHYLCFNAEEIEDGDTLYKCAPPIRERENNEQLWQALRDGHIDFIATDHSPAPPQMKETGSGNFEKAWGGIAGLQFSIPVVWTEARRRGITMNDVVKWMCVNPAKFLRLDHRKGFIKEGYDGDLVIFDTEIRTRITRDAIHHRHKQTPYEGREVNGQVLSTYVNGDLVYNSGLLVALNKGDILKA